MRSDTAPYEGESDWYRTVQEVTVLFIGPLSFSNDRLLNTMFTVKQSEKLYECALQNLRIISFFVPVFVLNIVTVIVNQSFTFLRCRCKYQDPHF
jgi:hypothetical protein